MKTLSLLETMNKWTPEQLLAVHDFCQLMAETIWQHHGEQLIEQLATEISAPIGDSHASCIETNLSLPFEDELPF